MKKVLNIAIFQLLLSIISAMLLAQMSWIGRLGISIFYNDYAILKSPVQTGGIIFTLQLLVILILHWAFLVGSRRILQRFCVIVFLLASVGLAYTAYDFNQSFSHRILKSKFHFGGYLVWIGFMMTSIFYYFQPKRKELSSDTETKTEV